MDKDTGEGKLHSPSFNDDYGQPSIKILAGLPVLVSGTAKANISELRTMFEGQDLVRSQKAK